MALDGVCQLMKKDNPLSVYARVSQLAFVIIAPLLLFLWGGSAAVKHFGLPDWVMIIFVALAIIFMLAGAVNYLAQLVRYFESREKPAPKTFTGSRSDNDYYDEYKDIRK